MQNEMIERPAARYGRRQLSRRSRRRLAIGLGIVAVLVGVAVAWAGYTRLSGADVKGDLAGYRILDDHTVEVTISVTRKEPGRPVACIVRARSYDGDETGRREVLVPASADATVQVTTVVETSRPAAVGDVYGCGTDVPDYLVPAGG
jgi:hypothetical protein